jgi:drug/metabolite transporter (DMT)-like permease
MMVDERTGSAKKGQMLPGLAGICMFLMFMTMLNVYAGLHGSFGAGFTKYGILSLCTLLAVGIFGLLRLKKWGWAVVAAGCLLLSVGDFFLFAKIHQVFFMVRGIFVLVFFLYLVRPETRERLV